MRAYLPALAVVVLLAPGAALAQWSAQPGEGVRNAFGPEIGSSARTCRGACGVGCPSSCSEETSFECLDSGQLRRVKVFECGTHLGCRQHDDCLDRCSQRRQAGFDCQAQCHMEALEEYGFESATSWAAGGGPHDGEPIRFEYTRDAPNLPEPTFRCPDGSRRQCAGSAGECVTGNGSTVTPVFDGYPSHGSDSIRISGFRSGRICEESRGPVVCDQTIDIQLNGETRYGFEFAYENADPALPLVCTTSGDGAGEDFIGGLVAGALKQMPIKNRESEAGALLGQLQNALAEGNSLKDVLSGITIKPHGSEEVAVDPSAPAMDSPGVPRSVQFPSPQGRLVVPISEAADVVAASQVVVRNVRCTYRGEPVLEVTFRLHMTN